MTAAAWLKPVSLVRSWAALTVLTTANSSFAPTSARHRVLLGGRHRLAHQIVGTVEGRVSRHARGVPTNDQSSGRAYLTLSRRDARDCAPGPRRATRRSAQYRTAEQYCCEHCFAFLLTFSGTVRRRLCRPQSWLRSARPRRAACPWS